MNVTRRASFFLRRVRAWVSQPRLVVQDRVVTVNHEALCRDPIFLIGLHRSGTSLMRRVINAHPDIACPPETFFLEHYAAMLDDHNVLAGYRSFGHDRAGMLAHLRAQASNLHEGYRAAKQKRRWADKTPEYIRILPALKELFGPESRFMMIYRHPFDVAYSVDSRGWDLARDGSAGGSADLFKRNLVHMADMYARQREFEHSNEAMCVRVHYEDLVAQPKEALSNLMQSLGEEFHPQMLRYHEAPQNFGTEDPIVRGSRGFNGSHGMWVTWCPARLARATDYLGEIAQDLGYSLDPEAASGGGRRQSPDDVNVMHSVAAR